jgi:hypothetical protein
MSKDKLIDIFRADVERHERSITDNEQTRLDALKNFINYINEQESLHVSIKGGKTNLTSVKLIFKIDGINEILDYDLYVADEERIRQYREYRSSLTISFRDILGDGNPIRELQSHKAKSSASVYVFDNSRAYFDYLFEKSSEHPLNISSEHGQRKLAEKILNELARRHAVNKHHKRLRSLLN